MRRWDRFGRSPRRIGLLLVTLGLLLAACGPVGSSSPTVAPPLTGGAMTTRNTPVAASASVTHAVTVTRAASATADGRCDNAAMVALVARFLDAYNAGDQARLLAFFPARNATHGIGIAGEETYFQRYWDVRKPRGRDGSGFEAYARDDLPPYWALRHAQHERLQLLRVDGGGGAGRFGLAGIGFMLTRQADDLLTHTVVGKGEIDCGQGTFTVWSMGPEDQPAATPSHP